MNKLINFLPWRLERRRLRRRRQFGLLSISLVVIASATLYYWQSQEASLSRLQKRFDQLQHKNQQLKLRKQWLKEWQHQVQQAGNLHRQQQRNLDLLNGIQSSVAETLEVDSISLTKQQFNIEGVAASKIAITQLLYGLEGSRWLQNPLLKSLQQQSTQNGTSRYRFAIVADLSELTDSKLK